MSRPIDTVELDAGHCHENVAELWTNKETELTAIGVGYAMSEDELWRQHSWGLRDDEKFGSG